MLEFLAIGFLYTKLAEMAEDRGHPRSWGFLGPGLWIVGEVAGLFYGASLGSGLSMYVYGVIGALIGGALSWQIVVSLPDRHATWTAPVTRR